MGGTVNAERNAHFMLVIHSQARHICVYLLLFAHKTQLRSQVIQISVCLYHGTHVAAFFHHKYCGCVHFSPPVLVCMSVFHRRNVNEIPYYPSQQIHNSKCKWDNEQSENI